MKPELTIDEHGSKYWYLNGKYHREDGPAVEYLNGSKYWYLNGVLHREDGPAIELANGTKQWILNGCHHRIDGPAIESANGNNYWYINGHLIYPRQNLTKIPQTEDEMLAIFNQNKFVKVDGEFYFIKQYIKEFRKEWYKKYRLLFK